MPNYLKYFLNTWEDQKLVSINIPFFKPFKTFWQIEKFIVGLIPEVKIFFLQNFLSISPLLGFSFDSYF